MFGHRFFGTRYYGPRYWGDGGDQAPVVTATQPTSGVRHSRFLRRGPRLPWEEVVEEVVTDDGVVVAKPVRRRIKLPREIRETLAESHIPFQTHVVIDAPIIRMPGVGTAVLRIDDEEEAVLMALMQ